MTNSTDGATTSLRVERTYHAPAQAVFEAWTNPDVMRRWWHAGGTDWENSHAEAQLRVGGKVRVAMRDAEGTTYGGGGEYTEIDAPARLAFTWTWDDDTPDRSSLIELDFTERDGRTTVVLTHSGLASEESAQGHTEGWQEALDSLGRLLEG
jgi:uncharacterized protein YndB with AHSA1/START domain